MSAIKEIWYTMTEDWRKCSRRDKIITVACVVGWILLLGFLEGTLA